MLQIYFENEYSDVNLKTTIFELTVTFFDKMSYHGVRVKIKSGMVELLQPCVFS